MRPADAPLYERPEPFDGVRVHVAAHVDPGLVVDAPMLVAAALRDADVRGRLVGVDDRFGEDARGDVRFQRLALSARNDACRHLPAALDHAEYGGPFAIDPLLRGG